MPYNQNIPAATDTLNVSQADIQGNFQELYTDFGRNHVNFDGLVVADRGKHNFVTYPLQATIPGSAAGEFILYNKQPAAPFPLTGLSELFIQRNGGPSPYSAPLSMKTFVAGGPSYAYLACGLLLKFGTGLTDGFGNQTINLDAIAQVYTAVPCVLLTPLEVQPGNNYRAVQLSTVTAHQFVVQTVNFVGAAASANYNWIAIGPY